MKLTSTGQCKPDKVKRPGREVIVVPFCPVNFLTYPDQISIVIDIPMLTLTLWISGHTHGIYPVALGKPSTPTPEGNWHIRSKETSPSWVVLGSRWMGLDVPWGNYGIHGTNAPWSIGRYISNGCIRMHNPHVEDIFRLASINTPVNIKGTYPGARYQPRTGSDGSAPPILTYGNRGQAVMELQRLLAQMGFDAGPIDGVFGPRTEAAVRAFQRRNNLNDDGIVGPETYRRLRP